MIPHCEQSFGTRQAVWVRDAFICRYCGRKTIPPDFLRIVSFGFPLAFGWQSNWNPPTHRAYWDISTSLDHLVAVSAGGDWRLHENLVTACYRCQEQKNDRAVAAEDLPRKRGQTGTGSRSPTTLYTKRFSPPAIIPRGLQRFGGRGSQGDKISRPGLLRGASRVRRRLAYRRKSRRRYQRIVQ
jgi:hypothetical protein